MSENTASQAPQGSAFRRGLLSFVRRGGRMTASQQRAWNDLRPRYMFDVPRADHDWSVADGFVIQPSELFQREAPLIVEIGSGQGHAIVHAATEHPANDYLAIEVFQAGLARTMLRADWAGVTNLRLIDANAPEVLAHALPEASATELWVFFPDPWPKTKQQKRRLVSPEFLQLAARVLRPGGVLRLATDWEEYAEQMREVCDAAESFERDFAAGPEEWAPRYEGRVLTAFEQKGINKGRAIRDLAYRRS